VKKLLLLPLLLLCGCASDKVVNGVPNLATVDPGVLRGGQPTEAGWRYLKSQGITNVIKFNTGNGDAYAEKIGMRVVKDPISLCRQIFGPVDAQMMLALTNVTPGTFVHCTHGVNRTGTFFILDRMAVDHWSKDKAVAEADRLGWESSFWGLKHFVKELQY
jgi:hypothetical protein